MPAYPRWRAPAQHSHQAELCPSAKRGHHRSHPITPAASCNLVSDFRAHDRDHISLCRGLVGNCTKHGAESTATRRAAPWGTLRMGCCHSPVTVLEWAAPTAGAEVGIPSPRRSLSSTTLSGGQVERPRRVTAYAVRIGFASASGSTFTPPPVGRPIGADLRRSPPRQAARPSRRCQSAGRSWVRTHRHRECSHGAQ
jgi:hypothetical protein